MLREQKPDAVIAMRDVQLLRAWGPLIATGLSVPKDIRLVGCDDLMISKYWSPSLSTLSMPKKELGKHAVDVLLDKEINDGGRIFPVEMICRASSS